MARCQDFLHQNSTRNSTSSGSVNSEIIAQLNFVAYGIIANIIIATGIVGNIINLIVLTRPVLKGVTYVYLKWLAVSDLFGLLVATSIYSLFSGHYYRTLPTAYYYSHFAFPLYHSFFGCSALLVVAVTIERFVAVCLPSRFKQFQDALLARVLIAGAYAVAFLINIPLCFIKQPRSHWSDDTHRMEYIACFIITVVKDPSYQAYKYIKELILRQAPMVIVCILNTAIITVLIKTQRKKAKKLRGVSVKSDIDRQREKKFRKEKRLVFLLSAVVVMFVIGTFPVAILIFLVTDKKEDDLHFHYFRAVANNLALMNAAMNFYLYCFCSPKVRNTFLSMIPFYRSSTLQTSPQNTSSSGSTGV